MGMCVFFSTFQNQFARSLTIQTVTNSVFSIEQLVSMYKLKQLCRYKDPYDWIQSRNNIINTLLPTSQCDQILIIQSGQIIIRTLVFLTCYSKMACVYQVGLYYALLVYYQSATSNNLFPFIQHWKLYKVCRTRAEIENIIYNCDFTFKYTQKQLLTLLANPTNYIVVLQIYVIN